MNIVIQKPTEIKIKDTEYFAIDFDKSGILYAIGKYQYQSAIIVIDLQKRNFKRYLIPEADDEYVSGDSNILDARCFVEPGGRNVWFPMYSDSKGTYWKCFNLESRNYSQIPYIKGEIIMSKSRLYAYSFEENALLDLRNYRKKKLDTEFYDLKTVAFSNDEKTVSFSCRPGDSTSVLTISLSTGKPCLENYERNGSADDNYPSWCLPVADKTNNGFFMIYSDKIIHRDSHGIIDKQISFSYNSSQSYQLLVSSVYLSPDNTYCLIVFAGNFVRLVDLATCNYIDSSQLDKLNDSIHNHGIVSEIVASPDCRKLYYVNNERRLYEYDLSPLFKEVNNQQNGPSATTAEPTWESW